MLVCAHVCMHVHTCACACVCACMCLCMCARMCVHVLCMVCAHVSAHMCVCARVPVWCVCVHGCMCVLGHILQITERAQNKHLILPLKTSNFASLGKSQQNRSACDHAHYFDNHKRLAHNKQKQLKRSPNSGIRKRLGHMNPTWETLQPVPRGIKGQQCFLSFHHKRPAIMLVS